MANSPLWVEPIHHLVRQVSLGKDQMAGTVSAKIHHFWRIIQQKGTERVSWNGITYMMLPNTFHFFIKVPFDNPYSWSSDGGGGPAYISITFHLFERLNMGSVIREWNPDWWCETKEWDCWER